MAYIYFIFFYSMLNIFLDLFSRWHSRCEQIGHDRTISAVDELTRFFWHEGDTGTFSTQKEKVHLAEVREIFDRMAVASVFALIFLVLAFDPRAVSGCAFLGMGLLAASSGIIPFFSIFWRDVFHPLLFDNELWINDSSDLSYYLMPTQFFRYTFTLIIASSFLVNASLWLRLRARRKGWEPFRIGTSRATSA